MNLLTKFILFYLFTFLTNVSLYAFEDILKPEIINLGDESPEMTRSLTVFCENEPMSVDFTFTNNNSCSGTPIKFTSIITDPGTFTYFWDFGDGQSSISPNPTHIFTSLGCGTGTFNVSLTVIDDMGVKSMTIKPLTVIQKPDISFFDVNSQFNPFSNCDNASISNPGFPITVGNNSNSTACIVSYTIDWGDGSTPVLNANFPISHSYAELGAYNMVISAVGTNNCKSSITYIVKNVTNPSGGFISPGTTTNLCAPTPELKFEIAKWGTNSPGTSYSVDFGDNSPKLTFTQEDLMKSPYYSATDPAASANVPVPHIYTTSNCPINQFTAVLTVTNACNSTKFTADNITVFTKPQADFSLPPSICLNSGILFTNSTIAGNGVNCSKNSNYTWDFGDGTPLDNVLNTLPQNKSHTYVAPGTYTVTLTSENFCGKSTKQKQVTINELPTAAISGESTVCMGAQPPIITFTAAKGTSPYTFTYKINNGPNRTVQTTTGSNFATIPVSTDKPGTFVYFLVSVSENTTSCTQTQTGSATVVVDPAPFATITGSDTVCINDPSPQIVLTGLYGTAPYTFTYNINGGLNKTILSTTANSVTIPVPTNISGVYQYNLVDVKDAGTSICTMAQTGSATITVNELPPPIVNLVNREFCNGEKIPLINFSNAVPGTIFNWLNSNVSIGLAGSGKGDIGSFTAINKTSNPVVSTITVTPFVNGCNGTDQTFTITVNPSASVIFTPSDQTICSGQSTTEVTLSSSTAGANLSWSVQQPAGISESVLLTGTNTIQAQTLTNNTDKPVSLIYKAKATVSGSAICSGTEYTYSIVVNPLPVVSGTFKDTICSSTSFNISPKGGGGSVIPAGTKYTWGQPVISGPGAVTGTSGQSTPQPFISQTLINTTSAIASATYSVTPVLNNCNGNPFEIIVFIIPDLSVNQVPDQIVCNEHITSEILFSGNSSIAAYSWRIDNADIGLPVTGKGNIPSFTAVNKGSIPVKAIVTVTPQISGCGGAPQSFSITVNPSPLITKQPSSSAVCLGEKPSSLSILYKNGVGTPVYQWYSNTSNSTTGATMIQNASDFYFNPPFLSPDTMYYYCTVSLQSSGCDNMISDIARVIIHPKPVVLLNNKTITNGEIFTFCKGDSLLVKVTGAKSYLWNYGTTDNSYLIKTKGDYWVISTTNEGCSDTVDFSAAYYDIMGYTIQSDKTEVTTNQNTVHLWSKNVADADYKWDFGDGTNGQGYDLIHAYNVQDGYYDVKLTVINPSGCVEKATKRIWSRIVTIPNTFTPNDDGINDIYLKDWNIQVFNRNGILLFEGKDGWDGKYNGKPVANDTYFVVIFFSSESGTRYNTSYVTIIR